MFGLVPLQRQRNSGNALRGNDPFALMRDEFNSLFGRFFNELPSTGESWDGRRNWGLDAYEDDKGLHIRAELPGFETKDIDLQLTENVLTIEAKNSVEESKENGQKHFNHVRRSLTLPPAGVDFEKIEANYRNGVLEIHVPRLPEAQTKKISIKS